MRKKMITNPRIIVFIFLVTVAPVYSQDLPVGYINYYNQSARNDQFISSMTVCRPEYWKMSNDKSATIISSPVEDSSGNENFSVNMGIIKDMIFGEMIMEFEFMPGTNVPSEDISGFCFICPAKTADTYYTSVFGNDSVSFYYIKKNIPERIAVNALSVKPRAWNHVRITRDILHRSVTIVLNKDFSRRIVFTDPRLVMGFVGFATINTECSLRNIKVWAPTTITETFHCADLVQNQ